MTVGEHIMAAFQDIQDLRNAFDQISARFSEPMSDDEMTALLAEQAKLQEKIDAVDGCGPLSAMLNKPVLPFAVPDSESRIENLFRWRKKTCCSLQASSLQT